MYKPQLQSLTIAGRMVLFLFFILIGGGFLKAQDLVVNRNGDSLNCAILSIFPDEIIYELMDDDSVKHTYYVPKSMYRASEKGFYNSSNNHIKKEKTKTLRDQKSRMARLLLRTGFGSTFGGEEHDNALIQSHFDRLKSGLVVGTEVTFETEKPFDIGFSYSLFMSGSKSKIDIVDETNGDLTSSNWSDAVKVHFIAPKLALMREIPVSGHRMEASISPGFLIYRNQVQREEESSFLARSLGVQLGLDHDFMIKHSTGLTLFTRVMIGSAKNVTEIQGSKFDRSEMNLNLGRFELGVALSWYSYDVQLPMKSKY